MIKYLIGSICFLIISNINAQSIDKDSLWKIITLNKKDTGTINAYYQLGVAIADTHLDSADAFFEKGFSLSLKNKYEKGISDYYRAKTYHIGYRKNESKNGLLLADSYLKWANNQSNKSYVGWANFAKGAIYSHITQYDSAQYYFEKAMPIIEQYEPNKVFQVYNNLAHLCFDLKLLDRALEYSDKSIKICEAQKDTDCLITNYLNKGNTLYYKDDTLGSERCFKTGLQLAQQSHSQYDAMLCLNNLALIFSEQHKFDSSIIYLNQSLAICEKAGTKSDKIRILNNISINYCDQGNYPKAYELLNKLLKDTAEAHIPLSNHLEILDNQYYILCGLNRYKEATEVVDKYFEIEEIVRAQERQKQILEFDEKLKKSEQAKQLLEKENQLTKQRSTITYLLAGLGLTTLLGLSFFYFQRLKTEAKKKELLNLQREQELKATKAKLEGQLNERIRIAKEIHDDLGSSMTSISLLSEVLKKKIDTNVYPEINRISFASSEMVDKMNEIIWTLNIGNDNVQSLVAYIRKFATNFLDDAQLMLSFEAENLPLEKEIDGSVRRNIYLCVKESINNIVKHANAHKIDVKIDSNTEGLKINIKDDGKGINSEHISILGNGLKNMQKRMSDIGGQFLIHNNNGTEITLSYPF